MTFSFKVIFTSFLSSSQVTAGALGAVSNDILLLNFEDVEYSVLVNELGFEVVEGFSFISCFLTNKTPLLTINQGKRKLALENCF